MNDMGDLENKYWLLGCGDGKAMGPVDIAERVEITFWRHVRAESDYQEMGPDEYQSLLVSYAMGYGYGLKEAEVEGA